MNSSAYEEWLNKLVKTTYEECTEATAVYIQSIGRSMQHLKTDEHKFATLVSAIRSAEIIAGKDNYRKVLACLTLEFYKLEEENKKLRAKLAESESE